MAELLARVGHHDVSRIEQVLAGQVTERPHRIVVDAHFPLMGDRVRTAAAVAGVPYIIDPQTFYLQDYQDPSHKWPNLPFGRSPALQPADVLHPGVAQAIAELVIDYQIAHGATMLVAPYVHARRRNDEWLLAQAALWRATSAYLRSRDLRLPTIAVIAIGWRLLDRATWPEGLSLLGDALLELNPDEVALAGSDVDAGAHPEERVATFVAAVQGISRRFPVIAWNQGTLGEVAVAAGAVGYLTGIGFRERCDLARAMTQLRRPRTPGGSPRPVYVEGLRRSLPRKTIDGLLSSSTYAALLTCDDPSCCPDGRLALHGDTSGHALRSRLRTLQAVASPDQAAWRWHQIVETATAGVEIAHRLNRVTGRLSLARIDDSALRAAAVVGAAYREWARRHRAA
ncbi:MAG: hypothetical protein ACYC2Z_05810 [Candidatus Nanopelagicales bacterium]